MQRTGAFAVDQPAAVEKRFGAGARIYYQCRACRHQCTLVSGTMFEGTKLPMRLWMRALHLLTATKTNLATPC